MKNTDMTVAQMIEMLKEKAPDCPSWMLDESRMNDKAPTRMELMEFAECIIKRQRSIQASKYLIYCKDRFGLDANGNYQFSYKGFGFFLDAEVIETLLIHQIEQPLLEESPEEKYIAVWRFYTNNEAKEAETGVTWLFDFIDDVFIKGFQFLNAPLSNNAVH
ncbi:hypothetical protein GKR67_11290 [Providencia alcalifaciens]|uniref:Uncharacterized protein n=1 Tax=Providencia alcalifaciens TaxID=126385 RepID=A0AAW9VC80_9GAMM|nr:hypothetical protein [Providencia alcalifaciens]